MVLELDSCFGRCFCLQQGGVKEWTSGRVVSMVDVTSCCFLGVGEGGCQCWCYVLGEVMDVHALDILDIFVGIDFEDFFHNFCAGGRFLKT